VIRPHGNGLVFEDADRGVRVKASFVARELSKARICQRLGSFQPASERHLETARQALDRYSPSRGSQSLWKEYERSLDQARTQRQEAWGSYRDSACRERQRLKQKYRLERRVINALPVSAGDRGQLLRQLALRQTIETRTLKRKLAIQRNAIQKTWHPGTWRRFVASRAARPPCGSTSTSATRAGMRPFGRRKGIVRFSEMEWCCRSAIRTRSTEHCKST
jgi:hypothetical protein